MPQTAKTNRKKLQTAILTILLIDIAISAFHIQETNTDKTITIAPDGKIIPSTAPVQYNGDVYVLTKNISETITVQRNNTILDGEGFTIQGNGTGQGIILHNVENVTIKNTKITGFSKGIQLHQSPKNTITNNTITNSIYGILADESLQTTISNNIIQNNSWDGIFITASPNSHIINNTVGNQGKWGIYLGYSAESTLRKNTMKNNRYNFGVSVDFVHDIDTSNTVDNKPIHYWINQQSRQIPANAGFVAIIDCLGIEIRNLDLTRNGEGVIIVNSARSLIENSNITSNGYYAIYLINSNYNILRNNTIANNDWGGIAIVSSTGNTIINNTIKNNNTGINLQNSNGNHISLNNFLNNSRQAVTRDSTNDWDQGYPSSGNYWNDYKGKDNDEDGTGDTPYIIDNENQDNYPLMHVAQEVLYNHIQTEPILLITSIATIVSAVILAHFTRKRKLIPSFLALLIGRIC